MRILLHYLKPHKWLVTLVLTLAAVNMGFSLVDPIIFGKLINLAGYHITHPFNWHDFLFLKKRVPDQITTPNGVKTGWKILYGVIWLLIASITVAMISRIAKNFQDYFLNVVIQKFGAKVLPMGYSMQ